MLEQAVTLKKVINAPFLHRTFPRVIELLIMGYMAPDSLISLIQEASANKAASAPLIKLLALSKESLKAAHPMPETAAERTADFSLFMKTYWKDGTQKPLSTSPENRITLAELCWVKQVKSSPQNQLDNFILMSPEAKSKEKEFPYTLLRHAVLWLDMESLLALMARALYRARFEGTDAAAPPAVYKRATMICRYIITLSVIYPELFAQKWLATISSFKNRPVIYALWLAVALDAEGDILNFFMRYINTDPLQFMRFPESNRGVQNKYQAPTKIAWNALLEACSMGKVKYATLLAQLHTKKELVAISKKLMGHAKKSNDPAKTGGIFFKERSTEQHLHTFSGRLVADSKLKNRMAVTLWHAIKACHPETNAPKNIRQQMSAALT